MGGPKPFQEREQPKTLPDTKTGTQSQSHIPTLIRIPKNTHAPNVKTHNNGCCTLINIPHTYSILPGPGADTPEGQPAPGPRWWFPSFRGGDRQIAPAPAQTSAGTARNRSVCSFFSSISPPLSPSLPFVLCFLQFFPCRFHLVSVK
ncbi:hypothetical protein XENORESO_019047 [Xenotaenia resolanae]|uniref:Uncharacterized protein n=1 Tax=Xenotaenia resolanae TaxID=208358 RepID=A0ABV0W3Q0_9TELE